MATDQGPVVQSATLRGELVSLRGASGLTQHQVASALDWSSSKLIRIEGGQSSIRQVDLDALLARYGVTSESRRERLHSLNRGAKEPAWWDKYKEDISAIHLSYIGFEAGASFIRQFQSGFLPDLLQTADYAEAVTENSVEVGRVAAVVSLRLDRQSELAQREPQPRQYYVIDEAVIRRRVGSAKSPDVMRDQLRQIADRAERDDLVTVRVLPFDAGTQQGLYVSFTLLEFDGGLPDRLYIDAGRGEFAKPAKKGSPQVTEYRRDFDLLLGNSLSAEQSIELMRDAAERTS